MYYLLDYSITFLKTTIGTIFAQLQLKYNPGLFPTVTMQKNQLHNFTPAERITNKIYFIREQHVLLDQDLADLYDVETKHLIQAVKRNKARFPVDFMFQLSNNEFENLRSQIVTSNRGGRRYLPHRGEIFLYNSKKVNKYPSGISIFQNFVSIFFMYSNVQLSRNDLPKRKEMYHWE